MTEPFIVYDGLGIETDNDQGIQLGGRHGNTFISSGRGLTCKLPTTSNDTHQETSVTLQATLQGIELWFSLLTICVFSCCVLCFYCVFFFLGGTCRPHPYLRHLAYPLNTVMKRAM